ncbi:hypothetical protein LXL04_030199 [Taraxacum kok-saghyz]
MSRSIGGTDGTGTGTGTGTGKRDSGRFERDEIVMKRKLPLMRVEAKGSCNVSYASAVTMKDVNDCPSVWKVRVSTLAGSICGGFSPGWQPEFEAQY